ncbi:MAG: hypothetical protein K8T20_19270 [Planctomycetes bacterium]|nr:hypothetical protein [Planctomycetota bacterium]
MRHLALSFFVLLLAGCASDHEREAGGPQVETGSPKLNGCLAKLQVASCNVGGLPASDATHPVKARASLKVSGKDASSDPHHAKVSVFDPASGDLKEADGDGNLLVPVGGAIVAVAGGGAATVWWLHDKAKGGGDLDIASEGSTPVSVATKKPANPDLVKVTAKTKNGTVDCTPIAATGDTICAEAPLTPADAGPVTITATEGGEVIGTTEVLAVSNTIQFVPEMIQPGQTGQLVGQFQPAGLQVVVNISLTGGIDTAPQTVVPGIITGGPGNFTITFKGRSDQLSGVPLLTVTGTSNPIQASADVREDK